MDILVNFILGCLTVLWLFLSGVIFIICFIIMIPFIIIREFFLFIIKLFKKKEEKLY